MSPNALLSLNIIIYNDNKYWIAHCLELDILTSQISLGHLQDDIISMCTSQIFYALENNLLSNLLRLPNPKIVEKMIIGILAKNMIITFDSRVIGGSKIIEFRILQEK